MARRKADELEDFSGNEFSTIILGNNSLWISELQSQTTTEDAEAGSKIITEFLKTWADRTAEYDETEDDDAHMADADANEDAVELQLAELRKCYEEFRPRIEGNAWCQSVIATLWSIIANRKCFPYFIPFKLSFTKTSLFKCCMIVVAYICCQ